MRRRTRIEHDRRRGLRGPTLASLTVLSLLWLSTQDGRGGTYGMRSCNGPAERSAPAAPWHWVNATHTYANDECGSGGGFGINAGPMDRVTTAAVVLDRPSTGALSAVSIRKVRLWMIARLSGTGSSLFVAWSAGGAEGTTAAGYPFGPPGGDSLTSPYETPPLAAGTSSFALVLSCSGNTFDGCTPASVNPLEVRGAEVTLQEDVAPTGRVTGGSLLSGAAQSGLRSVDYSVVDNESGISQLSIVLGTTVVATQDFSGECAYADFAACARNRSGTLSFDTRKVPNGNYPLTLRIVDAAGNHATALLPAAITVANAEPLAANGRGATGDVRLSVGFVGRRGSNVTLPYTRGTKLRGRLLTSGGQPISNARVEVIEEPVLRGSRPNVSSVITRPSGAFSYTVSARGMSRTLLVRYRPSLEDRSIAASKRLRVDVAAAASFRVVLRGVRVTYRGRLRSRPIPRAGKRIHVQGRAVGGAWTTFAIRRVDRRGRFSGSYRLRVRRPGVRLQFRVRIPKESGYPYAASAGRAVTRTVR